MLYCEFRWADAFTFVGDDRGNLRILLLLKHVTKGDDTHHSLPKKATVRTAANVIIFEKLSMENCLLSLTRYLAHPTHYHRCRMPTTKNRIHRMMPCPFNWCNTSHTFHSESSSYTQKANVNCARNFWGFMVFRAHSKLMY